MNNKFDELTKQMAQSVTRRAALKKFGIGLAGMALACFGLTNKARATTISGYVRYRYHSSGLVVQKVTETIGRPQAGALEWIQ